MLLQHWVTGLVAAAVVALTGCTTDGTVSAEAGDQLESAEKCATCHPQQFASWKQTYHARMVRTAPEGVLPEALENWFKDARGNAGPGTGNVDGKPYALADVELVVGSKWKQRYLVKNPATGHHQFLDKQWNSYIRCWESYRNNEDWESGCNTCHASATTG
jgi:cytochrome c554/c'-like protein